MSLDQVARYAPSPPNVGGEGRAEGAVRLIFPHPNPLPEGEETLIQQHWGSSPPAMISNRKTDSAPALDPHAKSR